MATFIHPQFIFLIVLSHIFLFFLPSFSIPPNHDTICKQTLHPSFCKSILVNNKHANSVQDYGRFTITESLSTSHSFLSVINQHVQSSKKGKPDSLSLLLPLEDCHFLASLNTELLSNAIDAINSTETLARSAIDKVHTILSAILTNLDTCYEGLRVKSSRIPSDLAPHFSNGTMMYSVSLALFTHGWLPKSNHGKGRLLYENENNYFFNMVNNNVNNGRKLLQLGEMGIFVRTMVVVNPDGSGNFTTVNEAVNSAPNNTKVNSGYFGIYVKAGVYDECVTVASNKKYLLLVGDGINQTIITGNKSMASGWTTFNSATFAVTAVGFVAVNITFRNTAGPTMQQAVAFRSGSDLSAFYRCSFEAYQDTLYPHSMRQFYKECDIYGTVDFIFGNSAVVLQDCNMYPRQPLKGQFNAITAQGRTDPNQNTGFSIHNCNIRAADDLVSSNFTVRTYLGRPWKEYSRTVYMQTVMDSVVQPAGWHEWSGSFALDTLYYAEYNNTGPGSNITNRVNWTGYHLINDEFEASLFTVSYFLVGDFWLPSTGIPYTGGLLYI